jgi:hypothetical protein
MSTLFGHLAFSLIGGSLLIKDIFWLRILAIGASLCAIIFTYTTLNEHLFVVVQWNAIFILINIYRISILIQEKMNIAFTPEEQELYETQFQNFSPVEFMKMLRASTWRDVDSNEILAKEGEAISYLMLVYCGKADVVFDKKIIAEIKDGDFVGEMSFATDKPATATVVSKEPMRLLVWNKRSLKNLLTRNPSLHFAMQSILSSNLVEKLQRST